MPTRWLLVFVACLAGLAPSARAEAPSLKPFALRIVDDQTGRGVPLVELTTTSNLNFVTDSAGYAAITDPALLGRRVFFTVSSHGYEFPADGFGIHGRAVDLTPGGAANWKIKRLNIAERLYRLTGEGIYADSVLLGKKSPIAEPLLNAQVVGQDSTQAVVYRGSIRWFWGDTSRQTYPLGHFATAGATSRLPGDGGLAPSVGVDLRYFVGEDGFSRGMFQKEGATLLWMDGAVVVNDASGKEHLIASVAKLKDLGHVLERRLVELDDATDQFRTLRTLPIENAPRPHGHSFSSEVDCKPFVYFGDPLPNVRVPATYDAAIDPSRYEAFTCLVPKEDGIEVDRAPDGKARWMWRPAGVPFTRDLEESLGKESRFAKSDRWLRPHDVANHAEIVLHAGSVNWNPYRKKWVMIANQAGGKSSYLGEVYYLESDRLEGPWDRAVKVVTHDRYSFYNPVHHAFFDEAGGRYVYFEGTYSKTFSGQDHATPRYDYNPVMYRLDLADDRLR